MNAMKIATVLALSLTAAAAQAQYMDQRLANGQDVLVSVAGSTTGYNPILIKYIGTSPTGGTVAVDAATGDITLKSGVVGSSTADLTVECPVSGALGGVIDVSDAACNTLGEVVDAINGSSNWRAVIQDGLRSDSSDNTLTTLAETSAAAAPGLALAGDTAVSLQVSFLLSPLRNDIRFYLNGTALNENPFADSQYAFWYATWTSTGTGADTFSVNFSKPTNKTCTYGASSISCAATESVTTHTQPGGTSTVNKNFDFSRFGLFSPGGRRVVVRGAFATTHTAVTLFSAAARALSFKPVGR